MKEYIEKDALAADGWYLQRHINGDGYACVESMNILDIPAADVVERRKGEWEKIPPYNQSYWKCSCCGKENKYAYKDGDATIYELQDFFCPNCGADMRPNEEENLAYIPPEERSKVDDD